MGELKGPILDHDDKRLDLLSRAERDLYLYRMSGETPRKLRECAAHFEVSMGTISQRWSRVRSKLGMDPLLEWKETGKLNGGDNGYETDWEPLRSVPTDTIVKLAEMNAESLLRMLRKKYHEVPPEKIPDMVLKLCNAQQITKSQPVQQLNKIQRDHMFEIWPAVIREMTRRGISIQVGGEGMKVVDIKRIDAGLEAMDG